MDGCRGVLAAEYNVFRGRPVPAGAGERVDRILHTGVVTLGDATRLMAPFDNEPRLG